MLLQHQTWQEVEQYLARSNGIILPIGSTEQHGPNGLIGTDAICAEVIARGVGEAAGAMVGPTIGVGVAVHHMDFAGTMTVRPSTLIAIIHDYVLSLARHGFRRFFFHQRTRRKHRDGAGRVRRDLRLVRGRDWATAKR